MLWHVEEDVEKAVRYINGLSYEIKDEISILYLKTVEDAYQTTLNAEEKITKKTKLKEYRKKFCKRKMISKWQRKISTTGRGR